MKLRKRAALRGAVAMIVAVGAALAQTPAVDTTAVLVIEGAVKQEVRLTRADWKAMPRARLRRKIMTERCTTTKG